MQSEAKNVSKSLQKTSFMVDQITPQERLAQFKVRRGWFWRLARFLTKSRPYER